MPAKFDPKQVVTEFAGIVTGYAGGTFLKAARANPTWKTVVGSDGTVVRVRSRDATGMVTLTLMQSSPTNDIFSALAALDELSGEGVLPLLIKDLNGTGLVIASEAWIEGPSELGYGADLENREWKIMCADITILGGAMV